MKDILQDEKMILNKDYKKDVNFEFHYSRMLLSLIGVWPIISKESKNYERVISKFVRIIVSWLMIFVTLPSLIHVTFREKDSTARFVMAGPISFCISSIIKYCLMIFRRNIISECLIHMEDDWKNIENKNDRSIMKENVQVGRDLTFLSCSFLYSCTLGYNLLMPLFNPETTNEKNETVRTLVYPGHDMFVDSQTTPFYEIVLYMTFCAAVANSTVAITSCNLAAVLVSHACGQFQIVVARLENLVEGNIDSEENSPSFRNKVRFAVRNHVRVLGFSSKIEQVLREICCIEVVASTLILCFAEYYCMMEWNNSDTGAILMYFGIFVSLSFNIFIFCHIGELLKEQCDNIDKATYMSNWYNLPGKSGLAIVMIINTRNIQRRITAGQLMELSISSFGNIMRSTLAYLNMMRAVGF